MADEKDKHTPESVAAKVVRALLKATPQQKRLRPIRHPTKVNKTRAKKT